MTAALMLEDVNAAAVLRTWSTVHRLGWWIAADVQHARASGLGLVPEARAWARVQVLLNMWATMSNMTGDPAPPAGVLDQLRSELRELTRLQPHEPEPMGSTGRGA